MPQAAVVHQVGASVDLVGDRQEDQLRHERHGVARGPLLAGLLVETADQFFEDRAHRVAIQAGVRDRPVAAENRGRTQVHVGREKLLDQRADDVGLGEAWDLVPKLELLQDVLDVRRETVEIRFEVGRELLLAGAGHEVTQREVRGVVERLASGLTQGLFLVDDRRRVERGLHRQHGRLARLQERVEPPQHGHRQDHIPIFAPDLEVA